MLLYIIIHRQEKSIKLNIANVDKRTKLDQTLINEIASLGHIRKNSIHSHEHIQFAFLKHALDCQKLQQPVSYLKKASGCVYKEKNPYLE